MIGTNLNISDSILIDTIESQQLVTLISQQKLLF